MQDEKWKTTFKTGEKKPQVPSFVQPSDQMAPQSVLFPMNGKRKKFCQNFALNPLVPDAHYSERQDRLTNLFTKQSIRRQQMIYWRIFIFCIPGTNGLIAGPSLVLPDPQRGLQAGGPQVQAVVTQEFRSIWTMPSTYWLHSALWGGQFRKL